MSKTREFLDVEANVFRTYYVSLRQYPRNVSVPALQHPAQRAYSICFPKYSASLRVQDPLLGFDF